MKHLGLIAILLAAYANLVAQCATWMDLPNKDEVEEAHVLYRDFFKAKNYEQAMPYWEKVFANAPAADGKRDLHFSNGIDLLLEQFKTATDATKKEEIKKRILAIYDQWMGCAEAGTFQLSFRNMETYPGYVRGREAFNMYYTLNVPYSQNLDALREAVEKGGNDTEYIVLDPYARIVQYQFTNDLMEKEEAREVYKKLNEIADYNIKNNDKLGAYYEQAKTSMNAVFATIESYIFDCDYFKKKLKPEYEAAPNDGQKVAEIYNTLVQRGCDLEDPFMLELKGVYTVYQDSVNAVRMAELYEKNPAKHAEDLYKEGKYEEAIGEWKRAIEMAEEDEKVAEYNYWIGQTTFYKLSNSNGSLSYLRKGTSSSEYGGKAYMVIGDAYAKISRSCGDPAWDSRLVILAAIDKWAAAKSKDPSIASEASSKINNYSAYKPAKTEAFSRGIKEGKNVKVPCVGESVKLRLGDG